MDIKIVLFLLYYDGNISTSNSFVNVKTLESTILLVSEPTVFAPECDCFKTTCDLTLIWLPEILL